jgi:hypothetical protein
MMDGGCEREGEWNRIMGNTLKLTATDETRKMCQSQCFEI